MITLARLLAALAIVASAPLLVLASLEAYGVPADAELAQTLMSARSWAMGAVFTAGLAVLAEVWMRVDRPHVKDGIAKAWGLGLSLHVFLAAPPVAAKVASTADAAKTVADVLSWSWLTGHPVVAAYAIGQVLAIDVMAAALVVGAGALARSPGEGLGEYDQDPAQMADQVAATLAGAQQNASATAARVAAEPQRPERKRLISQEGAAWIAACACGFRSKPKETERGAINSWNAHTCRKPQ